MVIFCRYHIHTTSRKCLYVNLLSWISVIIINMPTMCGYLGLLVDFLVAKCGLQCALTEETWDCTFVLDMNSSSRNM